MHKAVRHPASCTPRQSGILSLTRTMEETMTVTVETAAATVQPAVITGVVAFVVGCAASSVSIWIYRNQTLTESNAIKTAKKLMQRKNYDYKRPFEILKRRIGGFEDEALRRILVRAGAVRFYQSYRDVYVAKDKQETEEDKALLDAKPPVEMWGMTDRWANLRYLYDKGPTEPEHNLPDFPKQLRQPPS